MRELSRTQEAFARLDSTYYHFSERAAHFRQYLLSFYHAGSFFDMHHAEETLTVGSTLDGSSPQPQQPISGPVDASGSCEQPCSSSSWSPFESTASDAPASATTSYKDTIISRRHLSNLWRY